LSSPSIHWSSHPRGISPSRTSFIASPENNIDSKAEYTKTQQDLPVG
jgi:hypothetical protein